MWDKQAGGSSGSHTLRAKDGHHLVDDGGKVQGEPKGSVDGGHWNGRREYVRTMGTIDVF